MLDLEDEHDDCRQRLLVIVARGTAIITEIYRLVELIPAPFLDHDCRKSSNKHGKSSLDDIICDFSYFKRAEEFEATIDGDPQLKKLDERFCDEHFDTLTRFYLTFEAVQRHAADLNRFIVDLEDEVFIGQSLESVLADHESRQLICEAHFQMGYMLLLIDRSFCGDLRERLIVSYYRYSAYRSSPSTNLDETCNLMRSTGYKIQHPHQQAHGNAGKNDLLNQTTTKPDGYPENYFARAGINQSVVNNLIAKLQTVDIYNQTASIFPHPDHRSNALAQQASILYILLYFCPNILKTQRSRMREITDKFFSDNWVVHVFMGEYVNLLEAWEPYRAARESLVQIYEIECVRSLSSQFNVRFQRNARQLDEYLREGWLDESSFIEHSGRILNCIRDSNVVLKWLLLHSRWRACWSGHKLIKSLSSVVVSDRPDAKKLCEFLQNLCLLEKKASSLFDKSIAIRRAKVDEHKSRACDMLDELVSIFNDTKPMRWVKAGANQGLAKILADAQVSLSELDLENAQVSGSHSREDVVRLINRIEAARESYLDGKSLQVVQLFMDIKVNLVKLLRYLDLTDDFKTILQSAGDFSYAWTIMDEVFTNPMQQIIKDNPENMFAFESVIIKLTSAFESQLVRIQEINAQTDLISVSQYYSSKLVAYARRVLQIVPATILELISAIIAIQADSKLASDSVPSRIYLDQLRDYAMPEQRHQMLELTRKISHYARGIVAMPKTSIGLMRIDSKQMLESGLRRELYRNMTKRIEDTLGFKTSNVSQAGQDARQAGNRLAERLVQLDKILKSYRRSFEYIQDFLSIYGLKMWQEELSRIVRASVEQASSGSLGDPPSFMKRILNELLRLTDPHETVYDDRASVWLDKRSQRQVLDADRLFRLIGSSLGAAGLAGLDRLCSALIKSELERLNREAPSTATATAAVQDKYLTDRLLAVGQFQLIRMNIQRVLSSSCRREARHLYGCLESLNSSLLATIRRGKRPPIQQKVSTIDDDGAAAAAAAADNEANQTDGKQPGVSIDESQLVFELASYLEWVGLSDPMSKIYTLELRRGGEVGANLSPLANVQQPLERVIAGTLANLNGGGGSGGGSRQPLYLGIVTLLNHFHTDLVV
jgi:WASH complex subunit strumpellin